MSHEYSSPQIFLESNRSSIPPYTVLGMLTLGTCRTQALQSQPLVGVSPIARSQIQLLPLVRLSNITILALVTSGLNCPAQNPLTTPPGHHGHHGHLRPTTLLGVQTRLAPLFLQTSPRLSRTQHMTTLLRGLGQLELLWPSVSRRVASRCC